MSPAIENSANMKTVFINFSNNAKTLCLFFFFFSFDFLQTDHERYIVEVDKNKKMYLKIPSSLHCPGDNSNSGPEFSNCQRILTAQLLRRAQECTFFRVSAVHVF